MSKGLALSVAGWLSSSLSVTVGASTRIWTPPADILTAIEAGDDLLAWLNDAARPWFGVATFSVTLMETLSPWLGLQAACNITTTLVPDAGFQALLDWPAVQQGPRTIYTQTGIPSTVDGITDIGRWIPVVPDGGGIARDGSYVAQSQPYAQRDRAMAEMLGKEAQQAALGEAQAISSDPRHASIWRPATGEWVTVRLGAIDPARASMPIYRTTLQVIG